MLVAAGAIRLGLDPVPVAKWLGLGGSVGLVLLLYAALRRDMGVVAWGAGMAAVLLGSSYVLAIWAPAGLETDAYALLLFGGLLGLARAGESPRAAALASLLLVAAALTRPEGAAFWLLGLALVAAVGPGGGARSSRSLAYAIPGLALVAHLIWRLAYYGAPAPNTYYTKTGGGSAMWAQGLHALGQFVFEPAHLPWLVAAACGAVLGLAEPRWRRTAAILCGATLVHLAYVTSVGGDGLRVHRFYVPVLAPMAFLAGLLFGRAGEAGRLLAPRRATGVVVVAIASIASLWTLRVDLLPGMRENVRYYQQGNEKLGRFLADTRPPDTRLAVAAAGAIPFYSRLPAIDMFGLNDPRIARMPFPERRAGRLMKWDNGYVLSREPDLIAVNRGYFEAGDPLAERAAREPGILAVAPLDRDLFARLAAEGSYALRPLRLQDGSTFFVFERMVP